MLTFLSRLTYIVDECVKNKIGEWTPDGKGFHIKNKKTFNLFILPYDFRTFRRQLHYYKFVMDYSDGMIFKHDKYTRDNYKNAIISYFKKKDGSSVRSETKTEKRMRETKRTKGVKRTKRIKEPELEFLNHNLLEPIQRCHSLCDYNCNSIDCRKLVSPFNDDQLANIFE